VPKPRFIAHRPRSAPTALLEDLLHLGTLGYVSPVPHRCNAFLADHVGGLAGAVLQRPHRNQVIVRLADKLVAPIARPPAFSRAWPDCLFRAFRFCWRRFTLRHCLIFRHGLCFSLRWRQTLVLPDPAWRWIGRVEAMEPWPAKAPGGHFPLLRPCRCKLGTSRFPHTCCTEMPSQTPFRFVVQCYYSPFLNQPSMALYGGLGEKSNESAWSECFKMHWRVRRTGFQPNWCRVACRGRHRHHRCE